MSAHWYINATAVTAMARPRTVHDFFGFPQRLFDYTYAAPGSIELCREVADAVQPFWVGDDIDSWGLDHGTWSILAHMYPEADIPVVQLSVHAAASPGYHVEFGARLAPLRRNGVLVMCSGNIVHNLGMMDMGLGESGFDWALDFDRAVQGALTSDPVSVVGVVEHEHFAKAVPTADHFLPMLYLAGLAAEAGQPVRSLLEGYFAGSLSMTSYALGV